MTTRERTFLAIKRDGVQGGLIGEIISRFEKRGFKLVGLKYMMVPRQTAEEHYAEHKERPFFAGTESTSSSPVLWSPWFGRVTTSSRCLAL
eukprot:EC713106.1.p1 GENE.EC713106.1~~EC713106.1.p1  ORF type:complete len:105 (+),score=5.09 EC713106.1:45-317(+)